VRKTGALITVEDHNGIVGLGSQLLKFLYQKKVWAERGVVNLGVMKYEMSGKPEELYDNAGIGVRQIEEAVRRFM